MELIPDIPEEIDIQLQRSEFLNQKFIAQIPDDDYDVSELGVDPNASNEVILDLYPEPTLLRPSEQL
jgi:uncharacterized membrane protein